MTSNNFETILNECALYVWEWNVPTHNVRFGVPSLEGLWIDDERKLFKLTTVLERVHPDDIAKIFVSRNSPVYKSDEMFQIDLRLRLGTQGYEWFCIRGKVISRDAKARPVIVHGVAINADQRYRAVMRLIESKNRQSRLTSQHSEYFVDMMQEVETFMISLAQSSDTLINAGRRGSNEEFLGQLSKLKGQAEHLMDFLDRFRSWTGYNASGEEKDVRLLSLWEHLAELQQVYSLNKKSRLHLHLVNPYDNLQLSLNVKVLDLLLENVVNAQIRNSRDGVLTMSYRMKDVHTLFLSVCCDNANPLANVNAEAAYSEEALGLGVCRLLAGRIHASVDVSQSGDGHISYDISIPLVTRLSNAQTHLNVLDEPLVQQHRRQSKTDDGKLKVKVLMGLPEKTDLFEEHNLFEAVVAVTSEDLLSQLRQSGPGIIFVDDQLPGKVSLDELLAQLSNLVPEVPIILVSSRIDRANRHHVEQLGAQYLQSAPLTVRKVNAMIHRYLRR